MTITLFILHDFRLSYEHFVSLLQIRYIYASVSILYSGDNGTTGVRPSRYSRDTAMICGFHEPTGAQQILHLIIDASSMLACAFTPYGLSGSHQSLKLGPGPSRDASS